MSRPLIDSILTKLGVENPAQFDDAKAETKARNRIARNGAPDTLTEEEKSWVASAPAGGTPATPEAEGTATPAPDAGAAAPKGGKAKSKPAKKEKAPKAAPAPKGEKKTPTPKKAPAKKEGKKPAAKATTKDAGAGAPKGAKKTPAKAADGKDAPAKKPVKKREGPSAGEVYRNLLEDGKTVTREKAMAVMIEKSGCTKGTASSVICWSKRPKNVGPIKNPIGFSVKEETRATDGAKVLTRKGA